MTIAEYLSATRFPLTTQQPPLSPSGQLLRDAFNWQALQEAIGDGDKLTANQQAVYAELAEKMKHNVRLARQVAAEEMRRQELAVVAEHPANQLALKMLAKMKVPAEPWVMPLVDFTRAYLDSIPAATATTATRETNNTETLRLHAHQLAIARQDWYVASLFLGDRESFQLELDDAESGREWATLKPWLDVLAREMRAQRTWRKVGWLLAENLWGTVMEG